MSGNVKKEKKRFFDETAKRLVREIGTLWPWILLFCLISLLLIACSVTEPRLLGKLIDMLYAWTEDKGPGLAKSLVPGILVLLAIYAVSSVLDYINYYLLNNVVSRYFCAGMRIRISEKIRKLPVSYVDRTPAGDVINRMMDDVGEMADSIYSVVRILLTGFLQMIIIAVSLFLTDWRMAIPVVILSPLSVFISTKMAAKGDDSWDEHYELGGKLSTVAEEAFTNYATTKIFNGEQEIQERFDELSEKQRKRGTRAYFFSSIVQPVIVFVNAVAYIAVAVLGGWLIIDHGASIGDVVTVILFARQFSGPMERIAWGMGYIEHVKAAAKRVFDLLDLPEEEDPEGTMHAPSRGRVEFRHVDFSYDPEKPLIKDLNMDVKPGQKVAIVGPTGAGKTTIVNLLMRFYDIDAGQILIDGRDITELSREENRKQFAMVLQDTWLFRGTVAENVAYGNPDVTREQIEMTCDFAYCAHFIRRLPQGYDTVISEDSTAVSSGQKQLLTIARALLTDRPLLILDEATSNVDTRTEMLIQKAMDNLMKGRTCFVIAHRLSTIMDADIILVLRDGQIVEKGTHESLLAQKGFYYEMFQSQYAI